jgi:serine/threonine protein kinase
MTNDTIAYGDAQDEGAERKVEADDETLRRADEARSHAADGEAQRLTAVTPVAPQMDGNGKSVHQIGEYLIGEFLGQGAAGTVHQATNSRGMTVAVKIIHTKSTRTIERAQREYKTIAKLDHPSIVKVFKFTKLSETSAIIEMELLKGPPLDQCANKSNKTDLANRLTITQALEIIDPIARAVIYCHKEKVIHRDIKPKNIVMHKSMDGKYTPKLIDFGITRNLDTMDSAHTNAGATLGTHLYMAPEQDGKAEEANEKSDLFGIAGVLYFLLSGYPPRSSDEQTHTPCKALRERNPEVSTSLNAVIMKALALLPPDRHENVQEFWNEV